MTGYIGRILRTLPYRTLQEMHDAIVGEGCSESDFYLYYKAAQRLEQIKLENQQFCPHECVFYSEEGAVCYTCQKVLDPNAV